MAPAHPTTSPGPSVLVIEDDPAICRLLEALLVSAGYRVRVASDGAQGLTLYDADRPDAVFLDVTLLGMSGWDVLRELRLHPQAPPVVMLSADRAALRRARQAGAAAAILKPFDIDEVLEVTSRLLGPGERSRQAGDA